MVWTLVYQSAYQLQFPWRSLSVSPLEFELVFLLE